MTRLTGHRYPTRWSLRQAQRIENKSEDQGLISDKRKREERYSLYIPREIIFSILLLMPAEVLHRVMKYVCKQWYDIVNDPRFIGAHSQLPPAGHIIQKHWDLGRVCYIEEDAGADRFKVTKLQLPFAAILHGSLNGLLLLRDVNHLEILYIMNLVTKRKLTLPPAVGLRRLGSVSLTITSSGHYKVVYVPTEGLSRVQLRVFTIGVDKAWRCIDVHGISLDSTGYTTLAYVTPLLVAGFLYWCCYFYSTFNCFALDVDTETFYQLSEPAENFVVEFNMVSFFSLGTSLGLMKGEIGAMSRLWKLRDVNTGEWCELGKLDIRGMITKVDKRFFPSTLVAFLPIMLIDGEFWFYRRRKNKEFFVVRYNLTNESFVFFPVTVVYDHTLPYPHVNTLVSPKKCYRNIHGK